MAYNGMFVHARQESINGRLYPTHRVDGNALYDFLFDHDYEPWFCNKAKELLRSPHSSDPRAVKDLL